jgi:hypothetical protein
MRALEQSASAAVSKRATDTPFSDAVLRSSGRGGRGGLLAAGAAGALLFPVVAVVEGATRPGYNAWTHYVSELSLSDEGWMQIANFIVCGLLIAAGAIGLARALPPGPGSTWGPRLVGAFGVSLVVAGVFVTDPLHGYPADTVATASRTMHGTIHGLNGLICFSALAAAGCVFARYFARTSRMLAILSALVGVLVPVLFVATQWSSVLSDTGVLVDVPTGVLQRITIVGGWSWLALLALRARLGHAKKG